jgi:hypothetical protein
MELPSRLHCPYSLKSPVPRKDAPPAAWASCPRDWEESEIGIMEPCAKGRTMDTLGITVEREGQPLGTNG